MARQRYEAYDADGTCARVWFEEAPDPPPVDADAGATVGPSLDTAEALALKAGLSTAVTIAAVKAVVADLVTHLST